MRSAKRRAPRRAQRRAQHALSDAISDALSGALNDALSDALSGASSDALSHAHIGALSAARSQRRALNDALGIVEEKNINNLFTLLDADDSGVLSIDEIMAKGPEVSVPATFHHLIYLFAIQKHHLMPGRH